MRREVSREALNVFGVLRSHNKMNFVPHPIALERLSETQLFRSTTLGRVHFFAVFTTSVDNR